MQNNNYNFQKLTPIKNSKLGIYENAINFVFENDDVRNIAITGQYGAGKSSLLETYKDNNKAKKFIHISLAHFTPQEDKSNTTQVNEIALEGKILNQLIHIRYYNMDRLHIVKSV